MAPKRCNVDNEVELRKMLKRVLDGDCDAADINAVFSSSHIHAIDITSGRYVEHLTGILIARCTATLRMFSPTRRHCSQGFMNNGHKPAVRNAPLFMRHSTILCI
ncbi:hypothetical protein C0J52_03926 [Blattella germanica]|nr:hypothetical protein C0J52_03926 [Blattella germanica]